MIKRLLILTLLFSIGFIKNSYCQSPEKDTTEVFYIVDIMPEYEGGMTELFKFIRQNLNYPKEAKKNNINGVVYVGFVIDVDGSIIPQTVKVVTPVHPLLDEEAIRIVKLMPKWKPGYVTALNTFAKVNYRLPIKFNP